MKKIKSWLFRDCLELDKKWWHRLVKVIFLSLFFLIAFGSYVAIVANPDRMFLSNHNISIKNTLYQFTQNYKGEDNDNTIPKFFEQNGQFGLLVDNKIEYVSEYSLGKSMCIKNPEKYLDGISKILYADFIKDLSYQQAQTKNIDTFTEAIKKHFYEDTTRRCYFFDLSTYDDNLTKTTNLSSGIINYKPNALFYIEATLAIPLIAFVLFVLFALFYYRLILYIVYGNKK